jgi:hypothetical protein
LIYTGVFVNQDQAVSLAIKCILRDGCSDITSEAVELKLIENFSVAFERDIKAKINRGSIYEMDFRPLQYILTPKNRYVFDYRKAAVITPACTAKFLSLVFQYADIIENSRVPVSSGIVFSCRFNPNEDSVFDKSIGYKEWREQTKIRAGHENCNFIVSCDIAAFYDRVNIHRIESTLKSINVPDVLVKHTNDLLLFWSKKDSYGIPVGNVASRILAEASLISIDQYLLAEGIVFTRYVDDYRLFAPSLLVAQKWMNKLTTRLFRDGLMLNTGKTQIRKAEPEKTNDGEVVDHNKDAAETVLKVITKLTGGYNRISRRFIMPAEDKHKQFMEIKIEDEISILHDQAIVEFEGIQKVVIASLIQKRFDLLIVISQICCSYLYGLDYFIDMLIKNAEFIPENFRNNIADMYENLIFSGDIYSFEWHCASVAKLLSHPAYFRKNSLICLYRQPAKDVTTYASMIALEGLQGKLDRSEFLTIREFFDRSDEWEKRRLLNLSSVLPVDERKAWIRAIKPTLVNDVLAKELCDEIIRG